LKFNRLATSAIAAITVVLGLSLVNASPAAAADGIGSWRAYGTTNPIKSSSSLWICGATQPIATEVIAQVCAVRLDIDKTGVQGAVIVRNNRSSLFTAEAAVDLSKSPANGGAFIKRWICSSSGIAKGSWSVCFGKTISVADDVVARGGVNGVNLGVSPPV
jgi:hypothetical protein